MTSIIWLLIISTPAGQPFWFTEFDSKEQCEQVVAEVKQMVTVVNKMECVSATSTRVGKKGLSI